MEFELILKFFAIFALVAGNAFFVASEIALTSARRSRIKQLADMGNRSAKIVQLLHEEPERFYSVTQIGITLVSLALGAIGMVTVSHILDPLFETLFEAFGDATLQKGLITMAHTASYAAAFVVISFLHVVAGELAPKVLAFHKAEQLSLAVAWLINSLYRTFAWLIWFMNKSSNALLWLFGQRDLAGGGEGHFSMSEEEIRTILSASEREGILNPEETQMIRGVFDLDEHVVRDAMIPRTSLLALPDDATVSDVLALFNEHHNARYPVYHDNLDNIVGVIAMKELLSTLAQKTTGSELLGETVSTIMLPPFIVPESKSLSELLKEFKSRRQHMAIVIDEFGGTAGIITLEDILEEIVGDYDDEFSHRHRHIKRDEDGGLLIEASMRIEDLELVTYYPFKASADYMTLGGLVYKRLGTVPEIGDVVELEAARLEVVEMDHHRITKVKFTPSDHQPARRQGTAVADGEALPAPVEAAKPEPGA